MSLPLFRKNAQSSPFPLFDDPVSFGISPLIVLPCFWPRWTALCVFPHNGRLRIHWVCLWGCFCQYACIYARGLILEGPGDLYLPLLVPFRLRAPLLLSHTPKCFPASVSRGKCIATGILFLSSSLGCSFGLSLMFLHSVSPPSAFKRVDCGRLMWCLH